MSCGGLFLLLGSPRVRVPSTRGAPNSRSTFGPPEDAEASEVESCHESMRKRPLTGIVSGLWLATQVAEVIGVFVEPYLAVAVERQDDADRA